MNGSDDRHALESTFAKVHVMALVRAKGSRKRHGCGAVGPLLRPPSPNAGSPVR